MKKPRNYYDPKKGSIIAFIDRKKYAITYCVVRSIYRNTITVCTGEKLVITSESMGMPFTEKYGIVTYFNEDAACESMMNRL